MRYSFFLVLLVTVLVTSCTCAIKDSQLRGVKSAPEDNREESRNLAEADDDEERSGTSATLTKSASLSHTLPDVSPQQLADKVTDLKKWQAESGIFAKADYSISKANQEKFQEALKNAGIDDTAKLLSRQESMRANTGHLDDSMPKKPVLARSYSLPSKASEEDFIRAAENMRWEFLQLQGKNKRLWPIIKKALIIVYGVALGGLIFAGVVGMSMD